MQFSVLIIAKERNRFLRTKLCLRADKNVSETVSWGHSASIWNFNDAFVYKTRQINPIVNPTMLRAAYLPVYIFEVVAKENCFDSR